METIEKTIRHTDIYTGPVFSVQSNTVLLPSGSEARRELILHSGGAGVLPILQDRSVLLVRQYRYGVQRELLEIPAGKLNVGEAPELCAKRELLEETGAKIKEIKFLGQLALSPAYLAEINYIYAATVETIGAQHLDSDEFLNVVRIPFDDAYDMAMDGRITDVKTALALLRAKKAFGL